MLIKTKQRPRYIALKIESKKKFDRKVFLNSIWEHLTQLHGEYGASKANLALINYAPEKGFAVLRCDNKVLLMVRAALATINRIEETPIAIHVLAVSGTLKALRRKILQTQNA